VSPRDNRNGWLAGVPLLLLACLVPPFVLFVRIAFALAGLAGLAIARWELLVVPVLVGILIALDETNLGVAWAIVLGLGIAGGGRAGQAGPAAPGFLEASCPSGV
jgi:hypothetical protein